MASGVELLKASLNCLKFDHDAAIESSTQWHLQLPDLQINWSRSNHITMTTRIQMLCWGDRQSDWLPDIFFHKKEKLGWMIHLVSTHKLLFASLASYDFLPFLFALITFNHFYKAASSHREDGTCSVWESLQTLRQITL